MSMWTFLTIIIVVAVLAGTFSEYHKRNRNFHPKDLDELNEEVKRLRKRLENLEAIAAADPEEFTDLRKTRHGEKDHAEEISQIIKKGRSKS